MDTIAWRQHIDSSGGIVMRLVVAQEKNMCPKCRTLDDPRSMGFQCCNLVITTLHQLREGLARHPNNRRGDLKNCLTLPAIPGEPGLRWID